MDASHQHSASMFKPPALPDPTRRTGERRFASGMAFTIELVLSVMLVLALLLALAGLA